MNEAANAGALVSGANNGAQLCRMIIVADMQPNGATFALTDLLVEAMAQSQLNLMIS